MYTALKTKEKSPIIMADMSYNVRLVITTAQYSMKQSDNTSIPIDVPFLLYKQK